VDEDVHVDEYVHVERVRARPRARTHPCVRGYAGSAAALGWGSAEGFTAILLPGRLARRFDLAGPAC